MKKNWTKILTITLEIIMIIIASFLVIRNVCYTAIIVNQSSMNPTLNDGDYGYAIKTKHALNNIKRFDIVVIKEGKEEIIKRIIGIPGEHISYKNNKLYVNDKVLEENFDFRKTNDFNLEEICSCNSIPEGKYLVLGDNRPISKDSRMIGLIDEKDILGKAVYRIWPISKFGNIYN